MSRRLGLIASLFATIAVLLACGTTTSAVQSGTAGAGTATVGATTTPLPPTATPTPNPGRYDGTWVDNAAITVGAGELIITNSGSTASLHAYGLCGTKCDWGATTATVGPYNLVATFNLSATVTDKLTLQLSTTDLKVVDFDSYTSATTTFYMHRGSALELRAFLYAGEWVNNDPNTTGIPQMLVTVFDTKISVHAYGACTPTYCDWGTQSGTYSGDPFTVVFTLNTITNNLSLSLLDSAGNSLQVVLVGSASGTHTYQFHKSAVA